MLTVLQTALGGAWKKAIFYIGVFFAVAAALWRAAQSFKNSGRQEVRNEIQNRTLSNITMANDARREASQADDIHPDVRKFYRD